VAGRKPWRYRWPADSRHWVLLELNKQGAEQGHLLDELAEGKKTQRTDYLYPAKLGHRSFSVVGRKKRPTSIREVTQQR
jgi:hypothetical protein